MLRSDAAGVKAESDITRALRDGGGFVELELLNDQTASVLVTSRSEIVVTDIHIDDDQGGDTAATSSRGTSIDMLDWEM
ncbi:hypothetical protein [Schumannella soli]|uniref:Uncharacterized protein n=1 Tax=Schumannella soli TaxID=2590779 RepID=A0A506XZ82_9MICO|nr:hypothetical protein [Schumannella soli]TPW78081.1 hypothetical protein FJ657_05495 [Schumannella soli]